MFGRLAGSRAFGPRSTMAAAAAAVLLVALGVLREADRELIGDEGTFVAMTASLAEDRDLRFEPRDLERILSRPGRPAGVILQSVPAGVTYSKPILAPLFDAPFYALGGERGVVVFQILALGAALALARVALARRAGGARAGETLLCFALASIVAPHVGWKTSETLQVSLALAGLALTLGGAIGADSGPAPRRSFLTRRLAPLAGAALLGLLVALREPNATIAAVPILAALLARPRGWRRAAELALVTGAVYAAVVGATVALEGAPNPYKTWRSTFDSTTGYPAQPDSAAFARFAVQANRATSDLGAVPQLDLGRSAYAALYFFVGRHSGLIAYFPTALALLWAAWRRAPRQRSSPRLDRVGRAALVGFTASALFYLLWWPENYFGGSTQLGNRYLLAAFPCLLFVPRTLPSRRALATAWLVALAFGVSALASVARTAPFEDSPRDSQSHAYAGLFRLLPYESVASAIDGRRDRYWAGDFLRFVDPFGRVDETSVELAAGAPATEVEIATAWRGTPLRFLAVASSSEATIEACDWLGSRRIRLTPDDHGRAGGVVEIEPSPAWRLHRFWWPADRAYRARFLRLRLEAAPGSTVRLRYLGRGAIPERGFARTVERLVLPSSLRAGESRSLEIALRNDGSFPWSSTESLPVLLAARFEPVESGESAAVEFRAPLSRAVAPGESIASTLALEAPRVPGRYRLTVDLVMEDVAWFAERVGSPLGETTVVVSPY